MLKNLAELYVSNNKLISLPPTIGNLKKLHTLDLKNNTISYVPQETKNLDNLTMLDLRGNGKIDLGFIANLPISLIHFYADEIDVEPPPDVCLEKSFSYEKIECLMPYFKMLTEKINASYAVQKAQQFVKEGVIDDCHLIAHEVGEGTFEKFDFDIAKSFASCANGCIEGCYHGVVETYVGQNYENPKKIISELVRTCDSVPLSALLRRQCIHGAGHGLLANGRMPIQEAIATCHLFEASDASTCLGGLFMENMNTYLLLKESYLQEVLRSICSDVVATKDIAKFTTMCFEAIGEGLMFYTGHDLEKSKFLCESLEVFDYVESCQKGAELEATQGI